MMFIDRPTNDIHTMSLGIKELRKLSLNQRCSFGMQRERGVGDADALPEPRRQRQENEGTAGNGTIPGSSNTFSQASDSERYLRMHAEFELRRMKERVNTGLQFYESYERLISNSGDSISGITAVKYWRNNYKQDRRFRNYHNEQKKTNPSVQVPTGQYYDKYRPPTPGKRRQKKNVLGENVQPAEFEEILPRQEMDDDEYMNYRRGYEMELMVELDLQEEKAGIERSERSSNFFSRQVDRQNPWPKYRDRYDYDNMLNIYYKVRDDMYILRLDNPQNFPTPREVRKEEERLEKIERDRKEAAEAAAREAEAREAEAREAAAREEAARAAKEAEEEEDDSYLDAINMFGSDDEDDEDVTTAMNSMDGLIINTSHAAIALPNKHADGFYRSIAIIRRLRGTEETNPIVSEQTLYKDRTPLVLRRRAIYWLLNRNNAQRNNFLNATARLKSKPPIFRMFLLDRKQMSPKDPNYEKYTPYQLGMFRAKTIMDKRREDAGYQPFNFTVNTVDEKPPTDVKKQSLIEAYAESQAQPSSWPTLYDVEALSFALPEKAQIHLYKNSGNTEPGSSSNGKPKFVQDWNKTQPIIIGPETSSAEPYRLLWSADRTMRFRPLVPIAKLQTANELAFDPTIVDAEIRPSQDHRYQEHLREGYYDVDPWEGRHRRNR